MFDLISEIALRSKFTDKKRVKELIQEERGRVEEEITSSGISLAVVRAQSYFSMKDRYRDHIEGVAYYQFISDLDKNFDKKADLVSENLEKVRKMLISRATLLVSVTIDDVDFGDAKVALQKFLKALPNEKTSQQKYEFRLANTNEGFVIPGKVQFVVKAADYRELGFDYSGSLLVLHNILSSGYLWNKIRVQGGAYGAPSRVGRSGTWIFASFRDPHLKETLQAMGP